MADSEDPIPRTIDAERVSAVQERMPAAEDVDDLAEMFGLLAVPGRLRLMMALLLEGELCVSDLAAVAQLSESSTSHSLRILRAHRVVSVRRTGRLAYYSFADSHVRTLLEVAVAHVQLAEVVHPRR